MHFCWQLDKLKHLSHEVFEHLNWLKLTDWNNVFSNWLTKTYRLKQCIFKLVNQDLQIETMYFLSILINNALIVWKQFLMTLNRVIFNEEVVFKNFHFHFKRLIMLNIWHGNNYNNSFSNLFLFSIIKNLSFLWQMLILKAFLSSDHNVNRSFFKHALSSCQQQKCFLSLTIFKRP